MMQTSSPLAAMSSGFGSAWRFDNPVRPSFINCGPSSYSQMSLNAIANKKTMGYFDLDMSMTSSPTSCLAADLSQNFHIDKSPAFPTPRRSLFNNLNTMSNLSVSRPLITPPPMPSSPAFGDMMDTEMSPLPHKTPYFKLPAVQASTPQIPQSSSPAPIDSPCDIQRKPFVERRKAITLGRRPSLMRRMNTTNMISKPTMSKNAYSGDSPQFAFGGRNSAPPMELDEMFAETPVPEEKKVGLGLAIEDDALMKPRQPLFMGPASSSSSLDGSPVALPLRASFKRPLRKLARRSLSMFGNPHDVVRNDTTDELMTTIQQSPAQSSTRESQILPCHTVKDDPLKRITKETMARVLDGEFKHLYDEHLVVDCRFEYEYNGGHIAGAINFNNADNIDEKFISTPRSQKTILIFHCEFSAHRAPKMAQKVRARDRQVNMHRYPELYYPEVYILEGGYSGFFGSYRQRCEPQAYLQMDNQEHKSTCEREMGKFRRNTKLARAQSYTFGANLQSNNESPIARRPMVPKRDLGMNLGGPLVRPKHEAKRMASF